MPSCAAPDETRIPTVREIMLDEPKISSAPRRRRQVGVGWGNVGREEKIPGFKIQNPGKIANCLLPELTGTLLHGSIRPTSGVCPVLSGL